MGGVVMSNSDLNTSHIKDYVSDIKDMKVGRFYYDPKQDYLTDGAPRHGEFFFVDENDEVIGQWFMAFGFRVSKNWFYSIITDASYARSEKESDESITAGIKQFYEERIWPNPDNMFLVGTESIDYHEETDTVLNDEERFKELFVDTTRSIGRKSKEVTKDDILETE